MPKSQVERELKFGDVELQRLRERLEELEAERASASSFEENWVLDRQGSLKEAGCLLRLRKDSHGAHLTYKGPVHLEGATRIRPEHETVVGDPDATLLLLESLGYSVVRRYQKMREEWRLGGVIIALDHTPIGDFAEFEGEGAERVAHRCGFAPESAERRSYLRLYDDYLKENPGAPEDMVFP